MLSYVYQMDTIKQDDSLLTSIQLIEKEFLP